MLYPSDRMMVTMLKNIYHHMQKDYDYMLVIHGGTGDGKSHFALNLMETWYKVILRQEFEEDKIANVSQDYESWLNRFKEMKEYDMNIFDESSRSLSALDFMTKISKDLNKLFDVFRCKKFFSVVILPNYFRLNKALREDRLRGLVWVNGRGEYRFYTKHAIKFLNGFNEKRRIKSMMVAYPTFANAFPEYNGILLEAYQKQKNEGVDEVLNEIIEGTKERVKPKNMVEAYRDDVKAFKNRGMTVKEISKELEVSVGTVQNCIISLRDRGEIDVKE